MNGKNLFMVYFSVKPALKNEQKTRTEQLWAFTRDSEGTCRAYFSPVSIQAAHLTREGVGAHGLNSTNTLQRVCFGGACFRKSSDWPERIPK